MLSTPPFIGQSRSRGACASATAATTSHDESTKKRNHEDSKARRVGFLFRVFVSSWLHFIIYTSRVVISYLNASGSRLSRRPSAVSACGYMKKPSGPRFDF